MTDFLELSTSIRNRRRELDAQTGELRNYAERGKALQAELVQLTETEEILSRVSAVLNSLGEQRQLAAQNSIEGLVTRGLQAIFDSTLSFHIIQTTKNNSSYVEFVVRDTYSDGTIQETSVMEARGGGLAATIGFLLRLVVMLLSNRDGRDNILILDETFAHVSAEYLEPLGEFLREIKEKTGVQIIMVTHQPEFIDYADTVYKFSQENGKTKVTNA